MSKTLEWYSNICNYNCQRHFHFHDPSTEPLPPTQSHPTSCFQPFTFSLLLKIKKKKEKNVKSIAAGYQTKRLRKLTKDIAQLKSHLQNNSPSAAFWNNQLNKEVCINKYGGKATLVKTAQCCHDSTLISSYHYCKQQLGHSVPNHPPNKKLFYSWPSQIFMKLSIFVKCNPTTLCLKS